MRVKLGDNLTIIKVGRDLKRVGKHCTKTLKCFLDQDLQTRFFSPASSPPFLPLPPPKTKPPTKNFTKYFFPSFFEKLLLDST